VDITDPTEPERAPAANARGSKNESLNTSGLLSRIRPCVGSPGRPRARQKKPKVVKLMVFRMTRDTSGDDTPAYRLRHPRARAISTTRVVVPPLVPRAAAVDAISDLMVSSG